MVGTDASTIRASADALLLPCSMPTVRSGATAAKLGRRLLEELFAMGEHEHPLLHLEERGQRREHDGLPRRRRAAKRAPAARLHDNALESGRGTRVDTGEGSRIVPLVRTCSSDGVEDRRTMGPVMLPTRLVASPNQPPGKRG